MWKNFSQSHSVRQNIFIFHYSEYFLIIIGNLPTMSEIFSRPSLNRAAKLIISSSK